MVAVAQLGDLRRASRLSQYSDDPRCRRSCWPRRPAAAAGRAVHGRPERLRLLRGRGADRVSGGRAAARRRAGCSRRPASSPTCRRSASTSIDSLTSGLTTTDMSGTVMTFNRAAEAITGLRARDAIGRQIEDVLQFRCSCRVVDTDGVAFGPARSGRPRPGCRASRSASRCARRPADRARPERRAADDAARRDRLHPHVPGRDRVAQARAGSAGAAAAGGGRRDGRRASRTRSATRWRRCPGRSRSCGRSCRSPTSRGS